MRAMALTVAYFLINFLSVAALLLLVLGYRLICLSYCFSDQCYDILRELLHDSSLFKLRNETLHADGRVVPPSRSNT